MVKSLTGFKEDLKKIRKVNYLEPKDFSIVESYNIADIVHNVALEKYKEKLKERILKIKDDYQYSNEGIVIIWKILELLED